MTIHWYRNNLVVATKAMPPKHYSAKQGYQANKRARANLIDTASMYLLSAVGKENATAYLVTLGNNMSFYKDGNITPLIDQIASATEPYMTETVKTQLNNILNVTY